MTEPQFFNFLSWHKDNFEITPNGEIRTKDSSYSCPIVFVTKVLCLAWDYDNSQYIYAADKIGLERSFAKRVANAADGYFRHDEESVMRTKLEEALCLTTPTASRV